MHRGPKLASPANKSVTKDVAGEEPMKAGQFIAVSLCAVAAATSAQARITRISITKVELPAFDGRAFGGVGQYEKLVGRATGEVDPSDPRNAIITDIALAPRNANAEPFGGGTQMPSKQKVRGGILGSGFAANAACATRASILPMA